MNLTNSIKQGYIPLTNRANSSVSDWMCIALRQEAISTKGTVHSSGYEGAVEHKQEKQFLNLIEKLKRKFQPVEIAEKNILQYTRKGDLESTGKMEFTYVFINFDTWFSVKYNGKQSSIYIESLNKETIKNIIGEFSLILKKKKERHGRTYTILKEDSIYISDLGVGGAPFSAENYEQHVVDDYKFLVKDLSSNNPRGRLVILDGIPGSGKTYFVRGLINDIKNSIFVIIPSSLIGHISDPSFMPAIINMHEEERIPITFILEDADHALLPRATDNMSIISDLLNFADGIVGNIIDLRIIATTNAKKVEIEPALIRKGRLSKAVSFNKLSIKKSQEVFSKLTENISSNITNPIKKGIKEEMILADIYDLVRTVIEEYNIENK